jgi:glycerophosphoryl diester phosphodiesterase
MGRWPYLNPPDGVAAPLAFAHRGGSDEAPENSLRAFRAAVRLGFRYLETDVHTTRDGVLVAFHDDVLDRVTDRIGVIERLSWRQIAAARIAGTEPIPKLTDLLEEFPDIRINIDPKSDLAVDPLVEVIRSTGCIDRVCIGSFSDRRLDRVRRLLGPDLCTGLGPREVARLRVTRPGSVRRFSGAAAQVPVRVRGVAVVDPRFVATAHANDIAVHVWTIDDPAEMHRLLDLGVDGIMTDRPTVLRDVLTARNQWSEPTN